MRIALLSDVTVELLARGLAPDHEVWMPPGFGAWVQTALAPPDDLAAFAPEAVFVLLDAPADPALVTQAVESLGSALPQAKVFVPDLADLEAEVGASFRDERMRALSGSPWSREGLSAVRGEMARLLGFMQTATLKALAVDFDGTLWDGVIGEDGADGINPRSEFQRGLQSLRKRGILLVGISKNNPGDVAPVWDDPRMVLKRTDFVDMRIGWGEKSEALSEVARTLNISPDAFAFIDDNPAERAAMHAAMPSVTVPDFPGQLSPEAFLRRFSRLHFPRTGITADDRSRTESYRAESIRRESAAAASVDDYLESLGIRTETHPLRTDEIARVAQLSQKTNQFNVCTNRYTAAEIDGFAHDDSRLVMTVHAGDRYGDLGLIAFVHVQRADGDGKWRIIDWVMSCRAMNRRIEFDAEREVERELISRGAKTVIAKWMRTGRNAPVERLFDQFGFTCTLPKEGEKHYEKNLHR